MVALGRALVVTETIRMKSAVIKDIKPVDLMRQSVNVMAVAAVGVKQQVHAEMEDVFATRDGNRWPFNTEYTLKKKGSDKEVMQGISDTLRDYERSLRISTTAPQKWIRGMEAQSSLVQDLRRLRGSLLVNVKWNEEEPHPTGDEGASIEEVALVNEFGLVGTQSANDRMDTRRGRHRSGKFMSRKDRLGFMIPPRPWLSRIFEGKRGDRIADGVEATFLGGLAALTRMIALRTAMEAAKMAHTAPLPAAVEAGAVPRPGEGLPISGRGPISRVPKGPITRIKAPPKTPPRPPAIPKQPVEKVGPPVKLASRTYDSKINSALLRRQQRGTF